MFNRLFQRDLFAKFRIGDKLDLSYDGVIAKSYNWRGKFDESMWNKNYFISISDIFEYLYKNPAITKLDLSGRSISAKQIIEFARKNKYITEVNFGRSYGLGASNAPEDGRCEINNEVLLALYENTLFKKIFIDLRDEWRIDLKILQKLKDQLLVNDSAEWIKTACMIGMARVDSNVPIPLISIISDFCGIHHSRREAKSNFMNTLFFKQEVKSIPEDKPMIKLGAGHLSTY